MPKVLAELQRCCSFDEYRLAVENAFVRRVVPYLGQRGDAEIVSGFLAACPHIRHREHLGASIGASGVVKDVNRPPLDFALYCCDRRLLLPAALLNEWNRGQLFVGLPDDIDLPASQPCALLCMPDAQATELSWRILDQTRRHSDFGDPSSLPQVSLLTARDLPAIVWLVAKTIGYAIEQGNNVGSARYRLLTSQPDRSVWTDVSLGEGGSPVSTTQTLRGIESASYARTSADVFLTSTHGLDACAFGGSGVVLCGLHDARSSTSEPVAGQLACGRGLQCPQGPYPVAMKTIPARIMALVSCNGFRPGAGNLTSDFNLGLSFLDGVGACYCSSIYSSTGGRVAATAIGAALASGEGFARAIAYANSLVRRSGVADCNLVAIGDPSARRSLVARHGIPIFITEKTSEEINCAEHLRFEIVFNRSDLVSAARAGKLQWKVVSDRDEDAEPIIWDMWITEDDGVDRLHILLTRFPEALGRVVLIPFDQCRMGEVISGVARPLAQWITISRLLEGENSAEMATLSELRSLYEEICNSFAALEIRSRYDGSVGNATEQLMVTASTVLHHARNLVFDSLLPRLCEPFWLTNHLGKEYSPRLLGQGSCQYCGSRSVENIVSHPISGDERRVVVCSQCGIIGDYSLEGKIRSIAIEHGGSVLPGQVFPVTLSAEMQDNDSSTGLVFAPRLSIIGQYDILPNPERACSIDRAQFEFKIPNELPPHAYFLKTLFSTPEELAFASRPFFVI